jgi:hypothetical protein
MLPLLDSPGPGEPKASPPPPPRPDRGISLQDVEWLSVLLVSGVMQLAAAAVEAGPSKLTLKAAFSSLMMADSDKVSVPPTYLTTACFSSFLPKHFSAAPGTRGH